MSRGNARHGALYSPGNPGQAARQGLEVAAQVTGEYGRPAVLKAAPALLVLLLAARLAAAVQAYAQAGVGSRMTFALGGELFARLQRLSLRYHSRREIGDLARRITSDRA